jgi:hypothetical protein
MGTAAELTRVDGVAAAAAAVLTWLDGACAAAGLAGARGPQKSHSFLFPLIQAHLIQKIFSLKKRHRVFHKNFYVAHADIGYPATLWCDALIPLESDTKCLKSDASPLKELKNEHLYLALWNSRWKVELNSAV